MITVECSICGRQHKKEGEIEAGAISHSICSKCAAATETGRGFAIADLLSSDREGLKQDIKDEILQGTVWNGQEKDYTDVDGLKFYEKLLAEVKNEIDVERQAELNKGGKL